MMSFFVTNLFIGVLVDFIGHSDGTALLTQAQQQRSDLSKFQRLHGKPTTRERPPTSSIRRKCFDMVKSSYWIHVSNGFILFNIVIMCCEYEGQSQSGLDTIDELNAFCLVIFTVEMLVKLVAHFPIKYWQDPWNKFDAVVVILSWVAMIFELGSAQAIRALRAIRIVLVVKNAKGIRTMFQTLMLSVYPSLNISVLLLLLYALFGAPPPFSLPPSLPASLPPLLLHPPDTMSVADADGLCCAGCTTLSGGRQPSWACKYSGTCPCRTQSAPGTQLASSTRPHRAIP
jgi:hypothetical protein